MRDGVDGAQLAGIGADYGIACYSGGGFDGLVSKHESCDQDWDYRLHWKTRDLVDWAAGRAAPDRAWVSAHYQGQALLHRVDPRHGLSDADFATLDE
ncbi:hypothetical protein [Nocardia sp. NBC_00403]|uniref:hypothetical protein n=1 Tax=Nocardia sp. NBC_00403 TaxID=2975990 RepID=UPI002E216E2F